VSALAVDVSETPEATGEDGVWQTTQLDCAIGNVLRQDDSTNSTINSCTPDSLDAVAAVGDNATVKSDETTDAAGVDTGSRRGTV